MAIFVKCKEEFVTFKQTKKEQVGTEAKRTFLWFVKLVPVYKEVDDVNGKFYNRPVNLNMVLDISKTSGAPDRDSDYGYSKYKPAIRFDFGKYSTTWCYSDEKLRDEQFEEIANNTHLFKSKVGI